MKISDLNYLEVVNSETGNALAGGGDIFASIGKDINFNKVVTKDITKTVFVDVVNPDQLAEAEADAEAFGEYALAQTDTFAIVTAETAFAYSESTAALDLDQPVIPVEPEPVP